MILYFQSQRKHYERYYFVDGHCVNKLAWLPFLKPGSHNFSPCCYNDLRFNAKSVKNVHPFLKDEYMTSKGWSLLFKNTLEYLKPQMKIHVHRLISNKPHYAISWPFFKSQKAFELYKLKKKIYFYAIKLYIHFGCDLTVV